jgi:hypothetical protein
MISNCRLDFIDRINIVPVIGTLSSLTLLFMKVIGASHSVLKTHSCKELLITSIPIAGTVYLIYKRSLKKNKTPESPKLVDTPKKTPYILPPSPTVSSRRDSLDSQRSLSSEDLESLEQLQTTIANK